MIHDFGDFVKMIENVGRIGHSESQPTIFRNDSDELSQQIRQSDSDVAAVRSGVLGGDPDLYDSFLETLLGPRHDLRDRVRAENTASVFRLAVRTLPKEEVLSNFF